MSKKAGSTNVGEIELDLMEQRNTGKVLVVMDEMASDTQSVLVSQIRLSEWIGQRKFSAALQKLLTVSDLVEFQKIKETKSYKGLKTIGPNGEPLTSASFGDLCSAIGCSEQHINEQLLNLRTFGPDFLSVADQAIGFRDMRILRKLPDDQHAAMRELATSNDPEALIAYAADAIEKARSENAEMVQQNDNFKKREKNYEAELERAHLQVKRLSETKKRLTEFEPRTEDVRNECMALQLEAELPMNSLQKLFEEVVTENENTPESRLRIEQIWVTANIVASTALETLSKICDLAANTPDGNDLPARALGTHILTPEEAQNWLLSRPIIENRHAAEKALRAEKREEDKPKGPGRPKGSKNTKAED